MNKQVIEFLTNNPNSNKGQIADAVNLRGLGLFNLIKKMLSDGQITSQGVGQETTYSISEADGIEAVTDEQTVVDKTPLSQVGTEEVTGTGEQNEQNHEAGAKDENSKKGDDKVEEASAKATTSRDNSKYKFNDQDDLGKGPLVRAVVAKYVEDHPDATYKQLKEIFPDTLMKRFGVFANEAEAKKLSGNKPRYFLKPEQMIKIKGQKEPIAICNQWTAALIEPFIKVAKELGYKIK